MPRRVLVSSTIVAFTLACAPASARSTMPPSSAPPPSAASPPADTEPGPVAGKAPDAAPPGSHCGVEVEIREADRARGTGASDTSSDAAHDLAWQRACDDLRTRMGLDCTDQARVRVVKRSSSTQMVQKDGASTAHYEHTFELVGFQVAHGHGDAATWADACAAAADDACKTALGTTCPTGRVTVLKTDTDGEGDRKRSGPPPRNTI